MVRFNGNNFETLTVQDGLTGNDVYLAEKDRYGRLMLSTFGIGANYIINDTLKKMPTTQLDPFVNVNTRIVTCSGNSYVNFRDELFEFRENNTWSKGIAFKNGPNKFNEIELPNCSFKCYLDYERSKVKFESQSEGEYEFNLNKNFKSVTSVPNSFD